MYCLLKKYLSIPIKVLLLSSWLKLTPLIIFSKKWSLVITLIATEVNFLIKIVEFYYEVFHELLNSPFRRKGNMKRFITFFCEAFINFFNKFFLICHGSNWWRISWNFRLFSSVFLFLVSPSVEIAHMGRSMTFKMSKIKGTKASFFIATELVILKNMNENSHNYFSSANVLIAIIINCYHYHHNSHNCKLFFLIILLIIIIVFIVLSINHYCYFHGQMLSLAILESLTSFLLFLRIMDENLTSSN